MNVFLNIIFIIIVFLIFSYIVIPLYRIVKPAKLTIESIFWPAWLKKLYGSKFFLNIFACSDFYKLCAMILISFSFVYLEFKQSDEDVYVYENGEYVKQDFIIKFEWEWDSPEYFIAPNNVASIGPSVSAVSENPKVKYFGYGYTINAIIPDYFSIYKEEYALNNSMSKCPINEQLKNNIKSLCYNFNEFHSKEFAKLYNPLDEDQQKSIGTLFEEWMNPQIKSMGLIVKFDSFNLNPVKQMSY